MAAAIPNIHRQAGCLIRFWHGFHALVAQLLKLLLQRYQFLSILDRTHSHPVPGIAAQAELADLDRRIKLGQ